MAYMKSDEVIIPVFDGSDYQAWRRRILKFLEFKKCKAVAIRRRLTTDRAEEWDEAELKAVNYLYSAMSNKQLEYIEDTDSPYQIIKKFDEMYARESTALQIVCRSNLEAIKLSAYQDVTSFFDDFEKAVNNLKTAGAVVNEQEKLRYMIKALPRSYSHIGDMIDVLPETQRTLEYLKSKINLKSVEDKSQQDTSDEQRTITNRSNVFITETRGKCYRCGRAGHFKRDCTQHNPIGRSDRGGNLRGWTRDRGVRRGYQHRGGRGGGAGRGRASAHGYANTFMTQVNAFNLISSDRLVNKNNIKWILDSGCTDHIINDENLYNESIILKNPIDVKLGDGKVLKATRIGKVQTQFRVFNGRYDMTLLNVYYVKNMLQNLMSYSRITVKNRIVSCGNVTKIYNRNNEMIATAYKENNLFYMMSYITRSRDKSLDCNIVENDEAKNMTLKEK